MQTFPAAEEADILIAGGKVADGTGAPLVGADVAVREGRIAGVGDLSGWRAALTLPADGLVVAPGFIDMHTHSDLSLLINPRGESKIRQGVTTEVIGQCGFSPAPAPPERCEAARAQFGAWAGQVPWTWGSFGEYLAAFGRQGVSVNVVPVVGHGIIRTVAMGHGNRPPTAEQRDRMVGLAAEAMDAGAFGLSSGLAYAPGMFADADELSALASVVSGKGGIYFTHLRGEGATLLEAVGEAIEIGRRARVAVHISHLKAEGRRHWGRTAEALEMIDAARESGVAIGFDAYPYTAWNTNLGQLLPVWAREGDLEAVLGRLTGAATRARLIDELEGEARTDPGKWERRLLTSVAGRRNRPCQGMTIAEIAARRGVRPSQAVLDLLIEERMDAGMVGFGMCEEDVQRVLAHPLATIGSDAASMAPYGVLGQVHPHPRGYGAFARVLGRYRREERLFSLEEAVAKMTGRAAAALGLTDRGRIAAGCAADIAVFDPHAVADRATYQEPHQYAAGVRWVIVNGVLEIDGETHLDRRPGQVLQRVAG